MSHRADEARKLYLEGSERASQLAEFRDLLNTYASARRKDQPPQDLLNILRRYNSPWQPTTTAPMAEPPGFNRIFPSEYALQQINGLLHMPFFYRMNFIKQLSTTYLWRHWEAGHTRLAHSVGVAAVAQSFLDSIERNDPTLLDPVDRKAVITYAFIHDCFHGPLGHSMELMRDVFIPNYAERLDKYFLKKELGDSHSPIVKAISSIMGADAAEVIKLLSLISSKEGFKKSNGSKYFLAQIVDSRFDADRIDYVFRDCLHLGKRAPAEPQDVQEVIQRVRVLPLDDKHTRGKINSLHFSIHDKPLIESVLATRRELYLDFYEHPSKVIADEMICHALFHILSDRGVVPPSSGPLFDVCHNIVVEVGRLIDHDLLHFLYEAGGPLFAQIMLRDFITNDVYREIDHKKIRVSEKLRQNTLRLGAVFEQRVKEEEKRKGDAMSAVLGLGQLPHHEKVEIIRQVVNESFSGEELLFFFMYLMAVGGFTSRNRLEHLLWENVKKRPDFLNALKLAYFRKFGPLPQATLDELLPFPHVHISTPSYVGRSATELREYAKEPTEETLAFYDPSGQTQIVPLDLGSKERYETLSIMLSAPSFIAADNKLKEMIQEEFRHIFDSLEWADKDWLKGNAPNGG